MVIYLVTRPTNGLVMVALVLIKVGWSGGYLSVTRPTNGLVMVALVLILNWRMSLTMDSTESLNSILIL